MSTFMLKQFHKAKILRWVPLGIGAKLEFTFYYILIFVRLTAIPDLHLQLTLHHRHICNLTVAVGT